MRKHWRYGSYVLRHKWFVFLAGLKYKVPIGQLLVHDLSKFRPDEWCPSAEWFYGYEGGSWRTVTHGNGTFASPALLARAQVYRQAMLAAFLRHLHRNRHHHQRWRLLNDGAQSEQVFEIPERYAREMVADWAGAGRAITGKWDLADWYAKNRGIQVLHPNTRALVDRLIGWSDA